MNFKDKMSFDISFQFFISKGIMENVFKILEEHAPKLT
jgi:hypothetical protein